MAFGLRRTAFGLKAVRRKPKVECHWCHLTLYLKPYTLPFTL